MLSAIIINQAFQGWAEDPTITTLETIAAPIDDIQFPTVTVCSDSKQNPYDNWAFLESALNFLHYACSTDEQCKLTEPLRQDFKFLTKSVVKTYTDWLFSEDNLNHTSRLFPLGNKAKVGMIRHKFHKMIGNENVDIKDLMAYLTDYHMKSFEILKKDFGLREEDVIETDCKNETCHKIEGLAKLLHHFTNSGKIPFGSFVRNTIGPDSWHWNSLDIDFAYNWGACHMMSWVCEVNLCDSITDKEKFLHGFFANVSKWMGFREKVSLFELPSILSYGSANNILTSQLFMYQRCNSLSDITVNKVFDCHRMWQDYIMGLKSGSSSKPYPFGL